MKHLIGSCHTGKNLNKKKKHPSRIGSKSYKFLIRADVQVPIKAFHTNLRAGKLKKKAKVRTT